MVHFSTTKQKLQFLKLDRNYFKTHTLELAEEYLNTIPNITISNEERLQLENKKKQEKIKKLQEGKDQIKELRKELHETRLESLKLISEAINDPEKFHKVMKMAKKKLSKS